MHDRTWHRYSILSRNFAAIANAHPCPARSKRGVRSLCASACVHTPLMCGSTNLRKGWRKCIERQKVYFDFAKRQMYWIGGISTSINPAAAATAVVVAAAAAAAALAQNTPFAFIHIWLYHRAPTCGISNFDGNYVQIRTRGIDRNAHLFLIRSRSAAYSSAVPPNKNIYFFSFKTNSLWHLFVNWIDRVLLVGLTALRPCHRVFTLQCTISVNRRESVCALLDDAYVLCLSRSQLLLPISPSPSREWCCD